MQLNWLDRVGDWNPQLFREIKGRLKVRNVALAVATSLLGQLVLFLYWLGQVPNSENTYWGDQYCRLRDTYLAHQQQDRQLQGQYRQLQQQFSRYSGTEHYDPEKIQQLKGTIQEHNTGVCPYEKLMFLGLLDRRCSRPCLSN